MSAPLTTGRKFDPTFCGLHTNQQVLALALLVILLFVFMTSVRIVGIDQANKICLLVGFIEFGFGLYIGRSQSRLYHFECTWRFILSMVAGTDHIEKYAKTGMKKTKKFSYIKWIHKGGFIEYFHEAKTRPHNWGMIIWLDAFEPEVLNTFINDAARMFQGVPDKTVIKTSVNIRNDLQDYAEPITIQLQENDMPQIVRESMMEHEKLIKHAQIKNYENYMLIMIDYTSSKKKAIKRLDIAANTISKVLREDLDIENHRLATVGEVREAFFGQVTYNVHQKRRFEEDVSI
jgi:hypothetical protein